MKVYAVTITGGGDNENETEICLMNGHDNPVVFLDKKKAQEYLTTLQKEELEANDNELSVFGSIYDLIVLDVIE